VEARGKPDCAEVRGTPANENIKTHGVRAAPANLVIYASEQCHYSIEKSADILGLGRDNVRQIATDDRFHIRVDGLREAIALDRKLGRIPCCIVGVAGATSTGVIDPLESWPQLLASTNAGIT